MQNKTTPFVTIAIPTYNRADSYLKESLESAVGQTYANIEILVSDNCSSDHTEELVKSFHDSRIRYFKQPENIGSNNNCNFCLDRARGKYILFLFDDDVLDHDFIEVCVAALPENKNVGVVLTGAREIDSNGKTIGECLNQARGTSLEEFFLEWFANNTPLYFCSTLYDTQGLREMGGLHSATNQYEDVVATAKLMAKYQRADVNAVKASFRVHGSNLGASTDIAAWCEDSLYLLNLLQSLTSRKNSLLGTEGLAYFCKVNFGRAARIKNWPKRMRAYWTVAQSFNHSYSLSRFLYRKNIKSRMRSIARRFQQAFSRFGGQLGRASHDG